MMISTHLLERFLSNWPHQDVIDIVLRNRMDTAVELIGFAPVELEHRHREALKSRDIVAKTDIIKILDHSIDAGIWVTDV